MSDNKRIAKNTLFLYARLLVSLTVSLYTSRVILEVLGVEDFGVYNVVGGVVGMFSFLNGSLAGATFRFLNYELGKSREQKMEQIFNTAFFIHCIIAVIVLVLSETVGVWFINNKLVMPAGSQFAAHCVFQMSVLSAMLSITQAPYNASLMAEERMSVFAYFDIIGTILRLGIVFLLIVLPWNKLICYAVLTAVLSIGMMCAYRFYCISHFDYCRISFRQIDKSKMKPMLAFSGWDLYGNLSVVARTQGLSMLVNMFFGAVANAAIGIATQVQNALNGFATNVTTAIKPQIIKSYAGEDYQSMASLMFRGAKFSFLIILLLALPILIETPYVLQIWLKTVPEYTVWITRFTLGFIFFSNMSVVMVTGVHATGNIKGPSLLNGSLYLSVLPIAYVVYRLHLSIYVPFVLNVLFVAIGAIANCYYTHKAVPEVSVGKFIMQVVVKCLMVTAIAAVLPILIHNGMNEGIVRFVVVSLACILSTSVCALYVAMNKSERVFVFGLLSKIFKKLAYAK